MGQSCLKKNITKYAHNIIIIIIIIIIIYNDNDNDNDTVLYLMNK